MAAMRGGPRLAVGSAAWIEEQRSFARQAVADEADEFSYSVRNEMDWLNEHMADIFSENTKNMADLFKTPSKFKGKTPRTAKKATQGEARVPLSNIFSATPKGAPNPFAIPALNQAQKSKITIAEDAPDAPVSKVSSPSKAPLPAAQKKQQQQPRAAPAPVPVADSGYHGSQSQDLDDVDMVPVGEPLQMSETAIDTVAATDFAGSPTKTAAVPLVQASPTRAFMEETFQSAEEDQTRWVTANMTARQATQEPEAKEFGVIQAARQSPVRKPVPRSPVKSHTPMGSPVKASPTKVSTETETARQVTGQAEELDATADDIRSSSDSSSPIRPIVRKSSLNFASLPAREPLTSNKSLGPRVSRISHLDQSRTSYYHRQTGGKSLGANTGKETDEVENEDSEDDIHGGMELDNDKTTRKERVEAKVAIAAHNKTYTQRLQDQISMLGKSQPNQPRPSKSLANLLPAQHPPASQVPQQVQPQATGEAKPRSPAKQKLSVPAPGAFPDDDDDDWIAPPPTAQSAAEMASARPDMTKSHSTDVMEGLHGVDTIGGSAFVLPKSRPTSPEKAPAIPERTTSAFGHSKSASVPSLPITANTTTPKKTISVSNPSLNAVAEDDVFDDQPKSPSRTHRESPLKHVKNKLSSILKTSKGLLASSAALSAEGKASMMSPSTTRLGMHPGPSTDSLRPTTANEPLYPELPQRAATPPIAVSPVRNTARKTRASVEREKKEAKEKEKESKEKEKEAKRVAEQMEKLEKEREKEREKARIFNQERERIAAMEKQVNEAREQYRAPRAGATTPAPKSPVRHKSPAPPKSPAPHKSPAAHRSPGKATRTSPRKTKAQKEAEERAAAAAAAAQEANAADDDMEMPDAAPSVAAPSVSRPTTTPGTARGQALRRPTRPAQDVAPKAKAAPTLIRVKPTSAQQAQFHPSNSVLGSNLQDTLGPQTQEPRRQLTSKASQNSLHTKPSLQSLKSSVGSSTLKSSVGSSAMKSSAGPSGRPKALELAAKRREQEEREAQRKKEAKQELERKRAAMQEEERRKEQQRKLEMERQMEEERKIAEKAAQAKKDAQRQAAIERAKQTRAPPPASRSQPTGDYNMTDKGPSRPPSRLGSMIPQDSSRPVNASLHASRMAPKRTLQPDGNEDARPPMQRNGPSYQAKEAKRMRMSEEFDEDIDMADSQRSVIRAPPVRPSGGFKKELPSKSQFTNGYTTVPQGVSRDLFKTMVTSQHTGQTKATHALDTAQFSKGTIPFAPNPNPAGPSAPHKTPARQLGAAAAAKSAAKSAGRSSPFGKQGDNISLPDIQTDDEDEDSEDDDRAKKMQVASWTNSPDLRKILVGQETIDPMQIFGPPQAINMEEIFSKNKDRFHKFRARTSSANWSGSDRLTEEDIRKDLQARDRMRREGGWSYELARDGLA